MSHSDGSLNNSVLMCDQGKNVETSLGIKNSTMLTDLYSSTKYDTP